MRLPDRPPVPTCGVFYTPFKKWEKIVVSVPRFYQSVWLAAVKAGAARERHARRRLHGKGNRLHVLRLHRFPSPPPRNTKSDDCCISGITGEKQMTRSNMPVPERLLHLVNCYVLLVFWPCFWRAPCSMNERPTPADDCGARWSAACRRHLLRTRAPCLLPSAR